MVVRVIRRDSLGAFVAARFRGIGRQKGAGVVDGGDGVEAETEVVVAGTGVTVVAKSSP